jgi:hypothetical protein
MPLRGAIAMKQSPTLQGIASGCCPRNDMAITYATSSSINIPLPFIISHLMHTSQQQAGGSSYAGACHCEPQHFAFTHAVSTCRFEFHSHRTTNTYFNIYPAPADEYAVTDP